MMNMDLKNMENNIIEVVNNAMESVVSINSTIVARNSYEPLKGSGTGFIIDRSYIVTNNHVVENSEEVEVILNSGEKLNGIVTGMDPQTDIAVIKVNKNDLKPLKLGDSENIRVGQIAIAIGNSLGLPGGNTVSMGVVSAKNRPMPWANFVLEGLLQTDAAINPGNSGGPLMNLKSEVIGMNTAIIPFAQGIGFSIPVNTIKNVTYEIINNGHVKRKYLGITGVDIKKYSDNKKTGVLIVDIDRYGPAYESGLRPDDIIISVNDNKIETMRDLINSLSNVKDSAELIILRNGVKYKSSIKFKTPKIIKID